MRFDRLLVLVVLATGVTACADEVQILSAKIFDAPGFLGSASMTDYGYLYYVMQDAAGLNQDCYVNGVNISEALLGSERYSLSVGAHGGDYLWWGYGSATGGDNKSRVFVDDLDISTLYLGAVDWAIGAGISDAGVAWYGKSQIATVADVFLNGTPISTFLGNNRSVVATDVNNAGQVLWHGWGQGNGYNKDVFINDTNVSAPLLTGFRDATSADINNSGVAAWYGRGANTSSKFHAFRGTEDVSSPLIGPTQDGRSVFINDNNQLVWVHYLNNPFIGLSDVWLDDRNLSESILGLEREAWPWALNERGDVLWIGRGTNLDAIQDVFLNDLNISKQVLGPGRPTAHAIALNNHGWVLWQVPTAQHTLEVRVSMPATKTVSGHIDLEMYRGNPNNVAATMTVRTSYTDWVMDTLPLDLDENGDFTVAVPAGKFDLIFRAERYLARTVGNVDTSGPTITGITATLQAGDVDKDNDVDLRDLSLALTGFAQGTYDVNGDGIVDVYDLNIILKNMGSVGDN